jgi:outer membrane immunogenic protein
VSGKSSVDQLGWTAGAGTEVMLSPNWSAKAEYLYVDLGKQTTDMDPIDGILIFSASTDYHEHIARVGLNYHFN